MFGLGKNKRRSKGYEFKRRKFEVNVITAVGKNVSVTIHAKNETDAYNKTSNAMVDGCQIVGVKETETFYPE